MGVTKSTCDRYDIRPEAHPRNWAIVALDDRGGLFLANSDFGVFGHCWPHRGPASLREFLCQLDADYLLSKISRRDWFDCDRSLAAVRECIDEATRDGRLRGEKREEAVNACGELECCTDAGAFAHIIHESDSFDWLAAYPDWYEVVLKYDFPPDARGFVERIWPAFTAELRRELGL